MHGRVLNLQPARAACSCAYMVRRATVHMIRIRHAARKVHRKWGAEAVQGPLARMSTMRLAQAHAQEQEQRRKARNGPHRHEIPVSCGSQRSTNRRRGRIPRLSGRRDQVNGHSCSSRASGPREQVPMRGEHLLAMDIGRLGKSPPLSSDSCRGRWRR